MHQGDILFFNPAFLHGEVEIACGFLILGDKDDATGFAIEAIDNGKCRPVGYIIGQQGLQAVEERRRIPRHTGVNQQRGRLVDNDVITGFSKDSEIGIVAKVNFSDPRQDVPNKAQGMPTGQSPLIL